MILVIDVGNTRVKWAWLTSTGLSDQQAVVHRDAKPGIWTAALFESDQRPSRVLVSNVAGPHMAKTLTKLTKKAFRVNVEFVNVLDDAHAVLRVHERGVGETESCGSGACAVAAALAVRQSVAAGEWRLDVPGGRLRLTIDATTGHVLLSGPAVLVAEGRWLAR